MFPPFMTFDVRDDIFFVVVAKVVVILLSFNLTLSILFTIIYFELDIEEIELFCEENYMWIEYDRMPTKTYPYLSLCLYPLE